jgi:acetyl-CoA C-acetyltransferase
MRPVYAISGGVSKFAKARPDKTFQAIIKEAYDYAIQDIGLDFPTFTRVVDGSVASYFSDHFTRQLMAGIMAQDYLGLCPKPSHRVEGGGATGGLCFQEAWKSVASGHMDVCVAYGFETMSHVETWKGNEFIALASDVSLDYPVGGFYSGYYAMMVTRHMKEFGTTVEQMAHVSVKNYNNALHNPYAQKSRRITIKDVRNSPMVAWPLTRLDICVMSDGAAATILVSEEGLKRLEAAGAKIARPLVKVTGRPSARGLRQLHGKLRHRAGEILGRDEGILQETLGAWHALSGCPFVPRGTHGGQHGLETRGHQRPVERTGLCRIARCLHLV